MYTKKYIYNCLLSFYRDVYVLMSVGEGSNTWMEKEMKAERDEGKEGERERKGARVGERGMEREAGQLLLNSCDLSVFGRRKRSVMFYFCHDPPNPLCSLHCRQNRGTARPADCTLCVCVYALACTCVRACPCVFVCRM